MSEVKVFKTISGDEVIAKVVKEEADHWVLEKARILFPQNQGDGTVSLVMIPLITVAENPELRTESDMIFYTKNIMAVIFTIPASLEKSYLQQVSSIQLI